ncbi:MAG TPA: GerMN domain-containing protein [Thermoanaerobaculia bacterium]|nr:GerMN domain-containing protein [Thermoanaerobaculia bacterium]
MSRAAAVGLIVAALVVSVVAVLLLRPDPGGAPAGAAGDELPPIEPGQGVVVTLYFPGGDRLLHPVQLELPRQRSTEAQARLLLQALLAGPEAAGADPATGLVAPLPEGVAVRHVFRPQPDVLLVDLQPPEDPEATAMGSREELLAVFSLVDTLALNLDGIERVGLLVGGVQQPTFAGHVDTGQLLLPDRRLVAAAESTGG